MERRIDESALGGIAFVGRSLGPLFRYDPQREEDVIGPSYAAIANLNAREAADEWPFADADVAFRAICMMQEGLDDDLDESALTWEYRRLFVGPAKKAAPPWGSVYTDKDAVMYGASWVALREWLHRCGIEVGGGETVEPEDHIGVLLELAAWLAEERPNVTAEFLELHLLPWAPHFLQLVQSEAQHPFFEGLALLTESSLEGMKHALDLQAETPRFYR